MRASFPFKLRGYANAPRLSCPPTHMHPDSAVSPSPQRLRDIINKGLTNEELLRGVKTAWDKGWRQIKLYFMIVRTPDPAHPSMSLPRCLGGSAALELPTACCWEWGCASLALLAVRTLGSYAAKCCRSLCCPMGMSPGATCLLPSPAGPARRDGCRCDGHC